jgi:hypothetical protein
MMAAMIVEAVLCLPKKRRAAGSVSLWQRAGTKLPKFLQKPSANGNAREKAVAGVES